MLSDVFRDFDPIRIDGSWVTVLDEPAASRIGPIGFGARDTNSISRYVIYVWIETPPGALTDGRSPRIGSFYRPRPRGSDMTDADANASLASTLVALTVAFLLVTLVSGTLLDFNWTQAVLIGGFAGVVAVVSAWLTDRRADGG